MKAIASFTIDGVFVVRDVRVIEGTDRNFIAMPSKILRGDENEDKKYTDIAHPLNNETREQITSAILAEYEKVKASQENAE